MCISSISASRIANLLRSMPSSTADCGQMSLTLNTNGARLRREKASVAMPMGDGGDLAQRREGCHDERQPGEDALEKSRVGRREHPTPDDAHAVHALFHREAVAVSLVDHAGRVVRERGHDRDLVADLVESFGQLE